LPVLLECLNHTIDHLVRERYPRALLTRLWSRRRRRWCTDDPERLRFLPPRTEISRVLAHCSSLLNSLSFSDADRPLVFLGSSGFPLIRLLRTRGDLSGRFLRRP
jgi:hypothetical protein